MFWRLKIHVRRFRVWLKKLDIKNGERFDEKGRKILSPG